MISTTCRRALTLTVLLLPLLFPTLANAAAGHFLFVYGKVSVVTPHGVAQQATKGMQIEEGETITSGLHGAAQLRMEDGAFLAIRPNTVLRIDAYAFMEKGRKEKSTLSLLQGTFRAITGKIGKRHPQRDLVKTPVATIGIRGTDHEPAFIPHGLPGAGAYDKVNKGRTFIKTSAGTLNLGPNQIGHAFAKNKPPVSLPTMPVFYKTPDKPAVKEQQKENKKSNGNARGDQSKANGKDKGDNGKNSSDSSGGTTNKGNSDDSDSSDSGLVASSSHNSTVTDATTNNDTTTDGSTGGTLDTSNPVSNIAPTTDNDVLQTYSGTSDSGQTVNLTDQTTTKNGTTTEIGATTTTTTTTYAIPTARRAAMLSWIGTSSYSPSPRTAFVDTQWGDTYTTNSSGNVTGWNVPYYNSTTDPTQQVTGSVTGISSYPTATKISTGIELGSYSASSVNLTLADSTTSSDSLTVNYVSQPFNWITGPGISTTYLPMAYQATADSFTLGSYIATDETGAAVSLASNGITINFSKQVISSLSLSATTSTSGSWLATASNVPLQWGNFSVSDQSQPSALTISYTPFQASSISGTGTFEGALSGSGLTGLISSFSFQASSTYTLSGVAAFTNSSGTVNSTISHRWVVFASYDPRTNLSNTRFSPNLLGVMADNANSITYDSNNNITGFSSTLPLYSSSGSTSSSTPVLVNMDMTAGNGTVDQSGTDATTGISWGRWAFSSNTNSIASSPSGVSMPTFNPSDLHYIAGPSTDQPVQLPTGGTFTYTLAGNTSPTDNLGNSGTLDSASLKADFTNMTVDVGVQATVNGTTLAASGSSVPIQGPAFHAGGSGGAALTVTCSGTCSSINEGELGGIFTSNQSSGAVNGAALSYSMSTHASGQVGTVISGVAAFHK